MTFEQVLQALSIRTIELVDGDYVDVPDPEGFKAEPEADWPEDMPWVMEREDPKS